MITYRSMSTYRITWSTNQFYTII